MKIEYRVFLIEKTKRVFLRGFDQYQKACDYCRENKKQDPTVHFLITAYSIREKAPLSMYQKQIVF